MIEDYVVVDLETTGLNAKEDRIIEIGALRVRKGEITNSFSSLVNPGRKLGEKVIEITGINDEQLKKAPFMEDIFHELFAFLGEDVLIGQRILFDYSFLKKVAVNQNIPFERCGIDTLKIARKYLACLESRTLSSLCAYYQIPIKAHRALEDAKATCQVYRRLVQDFENEDTKQDVLFKPQPLIYKAKKESPVTSSQKEHLRRLIEHHKLHFEIDINCMTRNEASRIIDKILLEYGRL